jgi:hypothetical protein
MANDYNGYIASYREYQRGDHYRKALTGWGPHSSDYMATRLVGMAGELNGGPLLPDDLGQEKVIADVALNDQRADKLGEIGETSVTAYEAALPDDGGTAAAVQEPQDIERFDATFFKWVGGSNFTDNPHVKVQRLEGTEWRDYAGQSGEIPVTLEFPQGEDVPSYLQGGQEWRWTAHFEAFASNFETIEGPRATPEGTYRFVVDGLRREGRRAVPYHLESRTFDVHAWDGITVEGIDVDAGGHVVFDVGPRRTLTVSSGGPTIQAEIGPIDYPDSYASPIRFINAGRQAFRDPAAPDSAAKLEWYCLRCSFRPWADVGRAETAYVTIVRPDGSSERVRAVEGSAGSFSSERALSAGETAFVAGGDVQDAFGNVNGADSGSVERPSGM